jgi:4-hydroxy-tetrahydrodipicolinate synthase
MVKSFLDGDVAKSRDMQLKALDLVGSLFCEVNPIPVKAALNMMGKNAGGYRAPLLEMADENYARLEKSMKDFGLI